MNDVHYRWDCPKQTAHVFHGSTSTVSCNFYLSLGIIFSNRRVGASPHRTIVIQSPITHTKTPQYMEVDKILSRCLTIIGNYAVDFVLLFLFGIPPAVAELTVVWNNIRHVYS